MELIRTADGELEIGGVAVNPRGPAEIAVVTHATRVDPASQSARLLVPEMFAHALAPDARAELVALNSNVECERATIEFASSGRRGGAQLAISSAGTRFGVITGAIDAGAQVVRCDVLVLDCSYALPVFRWPGLDAVVDELRVWVQLNADAGRAALLAVEPLDEMLVLLAALGPSHPGPIHLHPQLEPIVERARLLGTALAPTSPLPKTRIAKQVAGSLVLAPPSELKTPTLPRLGPHETALASGRMRVRGNRRRLSADRGLVLSSRADWPTLLRACEESGAREVVTHGAHADALARWLAMQGRTARSLGEVLA